MILKLSKASLILTAAILLTGCCCWKTRGTIPDHISTYVIVGLGEREECPGPRKDNSGYVLGVDQHLSIWARSVYYNKLNLPVSDVPITFEVIDAFGDRIESPPAAVTPMGVLTNNDGFSFEDANFSATVAGVYRIKATYPDRRGSTISLSIPIIVSANGEIPNEALKIFDLSSFPLSLKGRQGFVDLPSAVHSKPQSVR
jgi:hypothetical protein